MCDLCKATIDPKKCGTVLHCPQCRYDVCNGCRTKPSMYVYDFDSGLAFPSPFPTYALKSFGKSPTASFRVIPAKEYVDHVASDRTHMFKEGKFIMPPPGYASPKGRLSKEPNNLAAFINMDNPFVGTVMNRGDFFRWGA